MSDIRFNIASCVAMLAVAFGGSQRLAAMPTTPPQYVTPCRPADTATIAHLHFLRLKANAMTSDAVSMRSEDHLPFVADTTQIVAVTDSATCTAALNAFRVAAERTDTAMTEIEVIHLDSLFIVSHPLVMSGEYTFRYVFNSNFEFIWGYYNWGPIVAPPVRGPTDLRITRALEHDVALNWSESTANVSTFRLQRATPAEAFAFIGGAIGSAGAAADTTALRGNTYNYRLVAYRSPHDSGFSNTVTVSLPDLGTLTRGGNARVFQDQFNRPDGELGSDWETKAGPAFRIIDGVARPPAAPSGGGGDLARVTDAAMTPRASMCFQTQMTSLTPAGSPMMWSQLTSGAALSGWIVLIEAQANNSVHMYSVVNGNGQSVAQTAGGVFSQNAPQTLKMCTGPGSQRVWLNGQLVINLASTVLDGVAGTIGIRDGGSSPGDGSWDDVVVTTTNIITVDGLPVGYKLRVGSLTSDAATTSGSVALDVQGAKFPIATIDVLEPTGNVVTHIAPTNGIWGGDEFTFTRS